MEYSEYMLGQRNKGIWIDILLVALLIVQAFVVRLPIVQERKIMPAGDVFNFQYITSHLMSFDYPKTEKRLPTYPLLLIPGRLLHLDPIRTSIGVSLVASLGIIALIYTLGRQYKIPRTIMLFVTGIAVYDPLLTINAIRPLSDSTFVCWILASLVLVTRLVQKPPSSRWDRILWWTGVSLVLMMFTRYEGFPIAAILVLSLFTALSWRQVLTVALLPAIATLLWIPVFHYVHGSLTGLGYVADATSADGGFGEIKAIPENFQKLMSGAGWERIWATPSSELTQEEPEKAFYRVMGSGSWWLAVCSFVGLIWLLITQRKVAVPLIAMASVYTILLSWWWVYSRYVAPLSTVFYIGATAGAYGLVSAIQRLHSAATWKGLVYGAFVVLFTLLAYQQVPHMYKLALSRSWEGNGKGYSLYQAIQYAGQQEKSVFVPADYPISLLMLGSYAQPKTSTNPGLGMYFINYKLDPVEAYIAMKGQKISSFLIPYQDERLEQLRQLRMSLEKNGNLGTKHHFQSFRWDTYEIEQTDVYDLIW
jgi:hypothetical protein